MLQLEQGRLLARRQFLQTLTLDLGLGQRQPFLLQQLHQLLNRLLLQLQMFAQAHRHLPLIGPRSFDGFTHAGGEAVKDQIGADLIRPTGNRLAHRRDYIHVHIRRTLNTRLGTAAGNLHAIIGGAVLLVVVAAAGVLGYLSSAVYTPKAQVESYLSALVDGEAEAAGELFLPTDGTPVLFSDEIYRAATNRITEYEITNVETYGTRAGVTADVTQNGRIGRLDHDGFAVDVVHTYGNCPKYIQLRPVDAIARKPGTLAERSTGLDATAQAMIRNPG